MKILITGSNGYIGSWLAEYLGRNNIIIGCGTRCEPAMKVDEYVQWDISEFYIPDVLLDKNIDVIVHTAAIIDKNDFSDDMIKSNCIGTYMVTKMAVHSHCKKMINISSLPIVDPCNNKPITEDTRLNPMTMYHATKAAGEHIVMQASKYGVNVVSLRVPSPIAPNMPVKTILPIFVNKALRNEEIVLLGKGSRKQNYLDLRDLCTCVEKIINSDNVTDGSYCIGGAIAISNYELAKRCIELTYSKSTIRFQGEDVFDEYDWTTNDKKIKDKIGDYQNISIDKTIMDLVEKLKNEACVF